MTTGRPTSRGRGMSEVEGVGLEEQRASTIMSENVSLRALAAHLTAAEHGNQVIPERRAGHSLTPKQRCTLRHPESSPTGWAALLCGRPAQTRSTSAISDYRSHADGDCYTVMQSGDRSAP